MENKEICWSLTELYPSFESPEFQKDLNDTFLAIDELARFAETLAQTDAACAIEKYIELSTGFGQKIMRLCDFCELTLSTDAENGKALNYLEKLEAALTETTVPETKFSLFIKDLDENTLVSAINNSDTLKEHEFFLRETKANAKYVLSEAEESVISKMEMTGSSSWAKYQENVMSTLTAEVELDGERKRLPFAEIRSLAHDKCPDKRKAAFDAELCACKSVAKACAASLNGIKGEALTVSKLRGYKSPLEMTVIDSRIDMDVLDALISSIRRNACVFIPYFKKKAELIGKEKLAFYDLFAPVGTDMKFTFEQAVDYVCENFNDFSPALGDYAKRAADGRWIDVYPKEGKRGGAFCQNMHYLKQSRFLLNFTGSFNDVLTLAHELGHGYHGDCLSDEAFLNSDYPMPIAETASTLCEKIVVEAALKSAKGDDALAILENGISGCAQVAVDILSRFIFESELFERRKEGSLSIEELCGIMRKTQADSYGDGLDHENLHEYMWVVKSHYYSASYNFYNFPYAFGMLYSNGLYAKFLEEGKEFAETYKKMLAATGKMNLPDVAAIAGIDIRDKGFWDSSFEVIKKDVGLFTGM